MLYNIHKHHPTSTKSIMPPTPEEVAKAHEVLYEFGKHLRKEVTGEAYVEKSLASNSSEFSRPMQNMITECGWGWVWARPELDRRTRSLINIAMFCAMNRLMELKEVHCRAAINNGCTVTEIREVLLQVAAYVGMPAGVEGTRVAESVLKDMGLI